MGERSLCRIIQMAMDAAATTTSEFAASLPVPVISATTKFVKIIYTVAEVLLPVQMVILCSDAASNRNSQVTGSRNFARGPSKVSPPVNVTITLVPPAMPSAASCLQTGAI